MQRNIILLKDSKFLEVLGDIRTVIFDKTGTLTVGHLDLIDIVATGEISNEELLCYAASAAWASNQNESFLSQETEKKQQNSITMVVGDGINDALALSEASVGVAMGAMGSDIAVQSADIALMGNELEKISFVIGLSRKAKKIIYQNMVVASATSAIMLLFAGLGIITPLVGAFLHNIGAFLVLLNSSRLLKFGVSAETGVIP